MFCFRLRGTIIRLAVPATEDLAVGSGSTSSLQNEIGDLLGIKYKNREYRNAVKWQKMINIAVQNAASPEEIASFLMPAKRKIRSDALGSVQINLIEQAWRECSEQSPNAKDTVRCKQLDGSYTVHARFACYNRTADVVSHLKSVHNVEHSITTVHNHKPYYIRNGTVDTCLCHYCENIRLMKVAILQRATTVSAPLLFVQAINTIKHFIRTFRFIKYMRRLPGFPRAISRGQYVLCWLIVHRFCHFDTRFPIDTMVSACRGAYKAEILDRVLCKGALPTWNQANSAHCGKRTCCGECEMAVRCGKCTGGSFRRILSLRTIHTTEGHNITATILNALQILPPDHTHTTIKYKTWGSAETGAGSGELVVVEATLQQFAEYVEERLIEYAHHIATLRRQKNAARQLEINLQPNMIDGTMDFSENMTLNVARNETQSAHWRTDGATLFICVLRHLCPETWFDATCRLESAAAVTVLTEKGFKPAVVTSTCEANAEVAEIRLVEGADGTIVVSRSLVHLRKMVTTPVIAISNDKHHDTYFVQHFLNVHIHGPNGWFAQQTEQFRRLHDQFHWNSDGAASHFKQVNTIVHTHSVRQDYDLSRVHVYGMGLAAP